MSQIKLRECALEPLDGSTVLAQIDFLKFICLVKT